MFQQWISAEIRCEKAAFAVQKGCFWVVKRALLVCKKVAFGM